MSIWKILGIIALVLLGGFLLMQIVPYGRDHTNPPVLSEPSWDSPETRALAKTACFDCHSNETNWDMWYMNIAPASWLVKHDVEEGRQRLNFSEWNDGGKPRETEDLWEALERNFMPPGKYTMMHPSAKLTEQQKADLIAGFQATVRN
jgi:hypothetical protein